jgi:hypothetical protein
MGGNIKMDIKETVCEGMGWIYLAQYRVQWRVLVNMVMKLQVPQKAKVKGKGKVVPVRF